MPDGLRLPTKKVTKLSTSAFPFHAVLYKLPGDKQGSATEGTSMTPDPHLHLFETWA